MGAYVGLKALGMGFDAHLTLVYLGKIDFDTECRVKMIIEDIGPVTMPVIRDKIRMFGYGKVPVVTVIYPEELVYLREQLVDMGVPNPSDYSWNPHITIKLDHLSDIIIPKTIVLTNLGLY